MTSGKNYPNPLIRGGPTHKHYDRDNTTTTALAGNGVFTGEWQKNTHPDVLISYSTPRPILLTLQLSDDDGSTWQEELISIDTPGKGTLKKPVGPRSFRLLVENLSETTMPSLAVYVYHGAFINGEEVQVFEGTGAGSEDDPLRLNMQSDTLEATLGSILKELKIMNLHLALMNDVDLTREDVE